MESHRKATYTEGLYIGEDARLAIALNANYVVQQVKLPTAAMGGISFCHFSEQGASNAIGSVPSRALRAQHWWCSHACGKSSVACAVLSRTEYSCTFSQVWPATTPARPAASANFIIVLGGEGRVLTLCRAARSELRTGRRALGCFVPGKGRGYAQFALFDRPAQTSSRIRGFGSKSSPAAARSKPSVECRVDFCPFSFFADLLVRGAVCIP